jgi:NDP-sugar pyrophosphorylase family protein
VKALILCAGQGIRLRPITEAVPKPLIEIAKNTTIFDRLLSQLRVVLPPTSIIVNISYLSQIFIQHLSLIPTAQRPCIFLEETPLGSRETVQRIFTLEKDSLVVVHGDLVLSDLDLLSFLEVINADPHTSRMVIHKRIREEARSTVVISGDSISQFSESCSSGELNDFVWSNSGIYFFSKLDLNMCFGENFHSNEIVDTLIPLIIQKSKLSFFMAQKQRFAIDSLKSLAMARKAIAEATLH